MRETQRLQRNSKKTNLLCDRFALGSSFSLLVLITGVKFSPMVQDKGEYEEIVQYA